VKKRHASSKKSNGKACEIATKRLGAMCGGGDPGGTVEGIPPPPEIWNNQHNETLIRL
jgi:hypothetical protein